VRENEQEQRNLDLVRAVYEASFAGDANAFVAAIHNDFEEYVPPVPPWGGLHRGPEAFLTNVLPQLAADAPAGGRSSHARLRISVRSSMV
jgi:ketosteroid isomerase-like protein